jgi:CRP/FNR family transcriptional regulator, cyclic AMP receptor protein
MSSPMIVASPAIRYSWPLTEPRRSPRSPYGLQVMDNCASCSLRTSSFFCNLSERSTQDLDRIKHVSSYPASTLLFMEGEEARGVYLLCQGRVKLLATNSEGRSLILKIVHPGEIIGLSSVLTNIPYEITVETLQPSQLGFVSREDFLKFIREHIDACFHVAQHASRDCHLAYEGIRSIGLSNSASEKLARFLLEWSAGGRVCDGEVRVKLTLTHEEMAQLIGCSRETVSRTLKEFKKQRLLEMNGSALVVRNKAALENLAAK